ncbi:MAG: hypothetical protein PHO41_02280 [Eubacteriales bacterium]|nr:hypothetical protein [Eubacteriales bacterium]
MEQQAPQGTAAFSVNTKNRTVKGWIKALLVLLLGLTVAHLGVTLFLLSSLGTDTFTVLIQGLSRISGLTVGTVHVIVLCLIMGILLFTTKGYVLPGTVVCAVCGGPIIDLFTYLLKGVLNEGSSMWLRGAGMLLGCVILSFGMSMVINSRAGTGPNDLVAVVLTDKLKTVQFRWVRMGCDLLFVGLGYLLGGTVGLGTLAAAVLTGPMVQVFLRITGKPIQAFLNE